MNSEKMNIDTMSDTEIVELFENAFKNQVAEPNDIEDPEVGIERCLGSKGVRVFVNLYGMAGSPTVDTYSNTDNISRVSIQRSDKGILVFNYVPRETRTLGGNEYQVVYDSE